MSYALTTSKFVVSQIDKFYDWNRGWGFDYTKKVLGVFDTYDQAYECGNNCGESFRVEEFQEDMLISSFDTTKGE